MNPLTILSFAASAWILILGVNNPWLSAFFLVAALLWRRVLVPTALLVLPMALSLAVIHIPFGHAHLAAELALRCAALVAVALAAFSTFTVADLAKALQTTRAPANLSYILSSALHILPEGRATFEKVGVTDPNNVIVYSGSGVHSAQAIAAMHHAGLPGAALYLGGWSQWCADRNNPVERSD